MESEWWRGAIIYQIYPRSFFDANEDGTGDLPGIIRKLDYISGLGVDAIWISPFFKSPMRDFGYDVSDYRAVDPIFGNNSDLAALLAAAHERGLRIVVDMVLAHTSDQHLWFQESCENRTNAKADWYVWADPKPDGTPPNNWLSIFGGAAWQWNSRRRQYYLHHYLREQPNLNWHNPGVVAAMFSEVSFWLDAGVDGLRLDAITTLTHDPELRDNPARDPNPGEPQLFSGSNNPFNWQELIYTRDQPRTLELLGELRAVVNRYDDRYLIGEVADVEMISVSAKYTRSGEHLHSCYNFELMQRTFTSSSLRQVMERMEALLGAGWTTWAMSNHDNIRVVTRCGQLTELQGNDPALAKLLLAALLSFRGGACIYQGEELGLTEAEIPFADLRDPFGIEFWPDYKGRDGCRTPMPWSSQLPNGGFTTAKPWLPIPAEHLALAVNEQDRDPSSVLHAFRRFLAWRKQRPALVRGDIAFVESNEPVLAFERAWKGERILCVFNFSNRTASQPVASDWRSIDGHGFDAELEDGKIVLPPFGVWFGGPAA
ncbi:MAG: alpha-glucosidase [Verrucomicrobia bacterium]|nr:alpha-glucosidase [Verrucomicrobiota bacterium]